MKPSTSNVVESSKPASPTCRVKQYQEIKDDIPVPVIALGDPAPPELIDVIRCQCQAQGKKCSTAACSCKKEHLACTSYCRRGLLPQSFHQETRCNGGIRQEWDHEEDANIDVTEEEGDEDEFV